MHLLSGSVSDNIDPCHDSVQAPFLTYIEV